MWDLNNSSYQQPRDDESEGCCSSQKTSIDDDEDKGKRIDLCRIQVLQLWWSRMDRKKKMVPINPYRKAKKMSEDIIMDFSKNSDMAVIILRYFNVIGLDPEGKLARGIILGLKVNGMDYKTHDETCIRDYIDVTDVVDAHVKALQNAKPNKVGICNVGTGRGRSVKEFVEACKKATGVKIKVFSDPTKIRRELNWTARFTDLHESLQIAWRWQKAHHDGYTTASYVIVYSLELFTSILFFIANGISKR
ncbi:putative UDP-arabinose 4-epimerase 3 [Hibiscus syriacus]|uniref:UDP-arabinose 4-epimerase 3 n=1 Tax=Hibiscus syriacus TaxID=106335 RepID=A0A6A2WZU7_HIBSY|nr:putative UDP-arabinose 4-epimerase 3 [Hibiscus syriacus]